VDVALQATQAWRQLPGRLHAFGSGKTLPREHGVSARSAIETQVRHIVRGCRPSCVFPRKATGCLLKALIQTDYGDPGKVLTLRDDVPEAEAGAGQVVIDMEAAVVQAADARTVLGAGGFRKKLPRTPGYEGVGRICAIGSGVTGVEMGMRVFAPLGVGTYRERVAVSAEGLMAAPEGDPVQVALLSLSPASALLMLQDFVKLEPDDWVVQNAANSAVGRIVIQLARELKIRVVNVVKSSPVISELKEIGAGAVLLDTEDLRDRVMAVTQGAPIRLALDAIGGAATARLAGCLADDAAVVSYGAMSGEPCHMPSDLVAAHGIRLFGMSPSRQLAKHTPEERKVVYDRIGQLVAARRLQARIAGTFELSQSIEAIRRAMSAGDKRQGKVAILIKELPARATANTADAAANGSNAAATSAPADAGASAPSAPTDGTSSAPPATTSANSGATAPGPAGESPGTAASASQAAPAAT
jgi:mitochondrial enoyl-[acyl-carrier protein] reductase / trans-2-enoyl-CoA reductase